ncbi:MAG: hypothetical protein BJ554DRAFT_8033, partial [Olpidium bornovanus]
MRVGGESGVDEYTWDDEAAGCEGMPLWQGEWGSYAARGQAGAWVDEKRAGQDPLEDSNEKRARRGPGAEPARRSAKGFGGARGEVAVAPGKRPGPREVIRPAAESKADNGESRKAPRGHLRCEVQEAFSVDSFMENRFLKQEVTMSWAEFLAACEEGPGGVPSRMMGAVRRKRVVLAEEGHAA